LADLVQPIILYAGCALGALGVMLALPKRGRGLQVVGALLAAGAIGAIFLAMGVANIDHLPNINYYVFSVIAIGAALRVISHPRPVYAALYFILTILASSGLYVILAAEFMAFALIIVYAGAILITYLFVIMLATEAPTADQPEALQDYDRYSREPIVATVAGFVLLGTLTTLLARGSETLTSPGPAAVQVAERHYTPGSQAIGDTGSRRIEIPTITVKLVADAPVSGWVGVANAGENLKLDKHSLGADLPVTLVKGENEISIPVPGVGEDDGERLDVWFTPAALGDNALLARLPGRVRDSLADARDPHDHTQSLLRDGETVVGVDVGRRIATVRAERGPVRTVPFPADLQVDNVEGVAFTLLDDHPGAIEIAGVILLMAMLGAVVLARKKVELDDAAKFAAQQRHLVEVGPVSSDDLVGAGANGGRA